MKKLILLFAWTNLLCMFSFAQDADAVWKKMLKAYSKCTEYSMNISVKSIPNSGDQAIVATGSVSRSGEKFFSSLHGITSLMGEKYVIQVNEHDRVITWNKIEGDRKKIMSDAMALTDTMGSIPPKVKTKSATEIVYVVDFPSASFYTRMEITLAVTTGYLTKVVYFYQKSEDQTYNRTEIAYTNIQIGKAVSSSIFDEGKYIAIKNNKATGVSKYSGYKIYNPQSLISSNGEN